MAYRPVYQLLKQAEKVLARATGRKPDEHREVVMKTNGVWPTEDESALRDVLEKAINDSGIAEVLGVDAGNGSVSLWIRMKAEYAQKSPAEKRAERKAEKDFAAKAEGRLKRGRIYSMKMPDPPPVEGDGSLLGFVLLLLDDVMADATDATNAPLVGNVLICCGKMPCLRVASVDLGTNLGARSQCPRLTPRSIGPPDEP